MDLAKKVAFRFARELRKDEFDKLVQWIGPKAHSAHRKFPRGRRVFDTRTRIFLFNIDPADYLRYNIEAAKAKMQQGATLADVVNPEAYAAMRGVLEDMKRRRFKFRMVNVSWADGGSYVEAILPRPQKPVDDF